LTVFVDTSALLAILSESDAFHDAAMDTWRSVRPRNDMLTTNAVLLEAYALLQRRHGMAVVRTFHDEYVSGLSIEHVS
jgi:predicted nucleic acid-binding protein